MVTKRLHTTGVLWVFLNFPRRLESIGEDAFAHCRSIEGIIFPESDMKLAIGQGAFNECYGINSIVCKGTIPPY